MIITHWIHHYLVCVYIYIFYYRSRYFRNSNKVIIKRGKSGGTIMLCAWTEEREGELKKMPGLWRRYVTSAVDFLFAKEKKKKLQKGFWVFVFLSNHHNSPRVHTCRTWKTGPSKYSILILFGAKFV